MYFFTDKCSIKRKSTGGGDATDSAKVPEEASPEKKAKLSEAEAESKADDAEVAA